MSTNNEDIGDSILKQYKIEQQLRPLLNKKLEDAIKKIDFNRHNIQNPSIGLHLLKKRDIVLIEGGGGGSTRDLLNWVAKGGAKKVVTVDLCLASGEAVTLEDGTKTLSGAGDYRSKKELFAQLQTDVDISKIFDYYCEDLRTFWLRMQANIEFRKRILCGKTTVDYYFDDATHDWRYLIPLFENIISICSPGAVLGTHDAAEEEMKRFVSWLEVHPRVAKTIRTDDSMFIILKEDENENT
ncbi:MAG: hypothetical protein Q8O88_01240 [bacterium]|nr:hypothetical protein [bacterium]